MGSVIVFFALLFIAGPLVLLLVFISKVNSLATRVQWLEQEFLRLRGALTPPLVEKTLSPPPPSPAPVVPSTPQATVPSRVVMEENRSRAREEWEEFVGGKLLNRIGAIALTIGVGFFLKYAFDNNWISETMRVLLGGIVGISLLLLGARFHRKAYHVFAQGLVGGGIAILYLSVFASFNFYHLVSQLTAFILMSLVTLAAFHQAFTYDSLAISLLGWVGGYLTPFLLSAGVSNEVGLFAYIDFLEAGLLAVVIVRQAWVIIEILTLAGTYLTFSLWQSTYYSEDALLVTVLFLTLFWTLFYLADLYRIISKAQPHPLHQLVNILNVGIFYLYLYALVNRQHHDIMGLLTVMLACLYALPAFLTLRRNPESVVLRDYILTTVTLLIIATSIQFSGFVTITLWACEALVLMWCAQRWGYRYLAGAALVFFVVIILKLSVQESTFAYVPIGEFTVIFNMRFLAFATLSASMGMSAYFLTNVEIRKREMSRRLLHFGWCILIFALLTIETVDFFAKHMVGANVEQWGSLEFSRNMTLLCIWMLYSLPLVYFGLKMTASTISISGLILTAAIFTIAAVWGISFKPIQDFYPILNLRTLALVLVLIGSLATARWLSDARRTLVLARSVYPVLLIGQLLLLLLLCTGETRDIFERKIFILDQQNAATGDELSSVENMKQLSLSILWLVYGIALMLGGTWKRMRGLRILATIILGVAVLKIFIYDLSFLQTFYRIFSFIGLGLVLLAASYMYQRYKLLIFGEGSHGAIDKSAAEENS
ncbi:MAG: DUF2339 domain-containing protein [Bacteroidota bacterium]|jgi:hypothetical protein